MQTLFLTKPFIMLKNVIFASVLLSLVGCGNSKEPNFRSAFWEMSKNEVIKTEKVPIAHEEPDEIDDESHKEFGYTWNFRENQIATIYKLKESDLIYYSLADLTYRIERLKVKSSIQE